MREIVFRGKMVGCEEWVFGDLCHTGVGEIPYIEARREEHIHSYAVYPETIGQFTELCDKNGKRIFEGDILKDDWGKVYEVIFTTKSCGFMAECKAAPNEYETGRYRLGDAWCKTIKVIGTIHDNPELLKGE